MSHEQPVFRRYGVENFLGGEAAAGKIHRPTAPVFAPDPPGGFPGFIELFAGQSSGSTDSPGNLVKQALGLEQGCMPGHQSIFAGFFHYLNSLKSAR
jgi:hypothetical protein